MIVFFSKFLSVSDVRNHILNIASLPDDERNCSIVVVLSQFRKFFSLCLPTHFSRLLFFLEVRVAAIHIFRYFSLCDPGSLISVFSQSSAIPFPFAFFAALDLSIFSIRRVTATFPMPQFSRSTFQLMSIFRHRIVK